jgi:hypothetical protein
VVGARVVVCAHPRRDGVRVAPGDQRIDEPVAAAVGKVVVAESVLAPVLRVVREPQVGGQVLARNRPRAGRFGFEDEPLLRREHRSGAQDLAGAGGVRRRDEIRMRAVRPVAGELEHPPP